MERLYNEFEVNNFKSGRNPSGEAIIPVAHPQTKGAEFSDAAMIQIYIIKGIDEIDIETADVDNSGKVDIDDATSVQKVVVGIYELDGDGNHVAA